MISYVIATTPLNGNATSITIAPPPAYQAGNLLVMVVTGGSTSGTAVSASTPSGWTARSASGLCVFTKTATSSEPASYTVSMAATCSIAVCIAAYPAATVQSYSFGSSGTGSTSYTGSWPSATSSQVVLVPAGAVASGGNAGYQNVVYPSGLNKAVPVFGQALPTMPATVVYPACAGLYDVTGAVASGLPEPVFTSPQPAAIYAGTIVLTLTGTPPVPYTVTASVAYPQAVPGLILTVKAVTGAASVAEILANGAHAQYYANGTTSPPATSVTPYASGSYVYGAIAQNINITAGTTFTANAATVFSQNASGPGNASAYATCRSSAVTTAGTPVTVGGSAPVNITAVVALAEILAAPGQSLAETATATATGLAPGNFPTTSVQQAAVFPVRPAAGTLLVAMVSANSYFNYGDGNAVATVTDSAGLTWTVLAEQQYPSYSGVFIAEVAPVAATAHLTVTPVRTVTKRLSHVRQAALTVTPVRAAHPSGSRNNATAHLVVTPVATASVAGGAPAHAVLDESGAAILDESGAYILDETLVSPTATAALTVVPSRTASRSHGHARAAALTAVPVAAATAASQNYNATAHLTVTPSMAAIAATTPVPANAILDEAGLPILDEASGVVLDESTPGVQRATASLTVTPSATATATVPATAGPWSAARAGLPGDTTATNWSSQVSQFLSSHALKPVYPGKRIWEVAADSTGVSGAFSWLGQSSLGWLPAYDVDQPFTLAIGSTTVGRVQVPVLASGNGADLQVLLCADNGSGLPLTASPLASVIIPASHITQTAATGSLASAGPLVVARHNTSLAGAYSTGGWTQPAVSSNGAGSFATPATSGNFTALIGGLDSTANVASGYTATIAYQGGSVSGGVTQPSLPQPAYYTCATITSDSVVVAGGKSGSTGYATAWTAPWTPGTGTIGAWSAQTSLPFANVYGAMASWGTQVYVIGGSANGTAADATALVWTASSQSGQVTGWTSAPPLPQALMQAYCAVVGNWLIVAGGTSTSNAAVAYTWYSAINADGSLAGWQQGPPLPQASAAFGPGWNTAVTDSAMIIVSGFAGGESFSPYTQVLSVSPDGPSDAWQVQDWSGSTTGAFQCAAYPSGPSGGWQVFNLHTASFDVAQLGPVALVSVPLPASGLSAGAKYHVVMQQSGGNLNDSLNLGVIASSGTGWLYMPPGPDASWTPTTGSQVAVNVCDASAAGPVLHLVQDSGAGLTTLIREGASGLLSGVMEAASFPTESPEAVLGTVTQVTWNGGLPSGLVTLA